MTRLVWGESPRVVDNGLDRGVLYLDGVGVSWNGLTSVEEVASGSLETTLYFDGNRYLVTEQAGSFEAQVSAYTYPDDFPEDRGDRTFGLSYRVMDVHDEYKIHAVYAATAISSGRSSSTLTSDTDSVEFQWDISTADVPIPWSRPAGHLVMDFSERPELIEVVENILYGTESVSPRLPSPEELYEIFGGASHLRVTDHGDGSWTAEGSDGVVSPPVDGAFRINAPTVVFPDDKYTFRVSSY